jgi:hypothetical protein
MAANMLQEETHHTALLREQLIFAILMPTPHQENAPIPPAPTRNALETQIMEMCAVTKEMFGTAQMAVNTLQVRRRLGALFKALKKSVI